MPEPIEPIVIAPYADEEDEERRRTREEAARILDAAGIARVREGVQPVANLPPPADGTPRPIPSAALVRAEQDARRTGAEYRATAPRDPTSFGSQAAYTAGLDRQGNPRAPTPAADPNPRPAPTAPAAPNRQPPPRGMGRALGDPAQGLAPEQRAELVRQLEARVRGPSWMQGRPDYRALTTDGGAIVAPGNLDIRRQPRVQNADGTVSNVRSMSIGTERGETLIPTVSPDGRVLSDEDAIELYRQSGRHMGVYRSPEVATAHAQEIHRAEEARGEAPTHGADGRALTQVRAPQAQPAGASPPTSAAPAGPDYTGADVSDAIRRPLHAIGAALQAAAGRSPRAFRSEREALEARTAREQQAAAQRAQQQSAADLQRERMGMERERLDMQRDDMAERRRLEGERNDISREMQGGRLDVSRRAAELRASGMGEQEALARARREALQGELSRSVAMRDPRSPESESERAELMAELETARSELGFDPPPGVMAFLSGASGEQAQRYRDTLTEQGILRPRTSRRAGGGGGGGAGSGVPRGTWGTDDDPVVRDAIAMGVPDGTARAEARDPRARRSLEARISGEGMQRARASGEQQRDGVDLDLKLRAAEDAVQSAIAALPPEGQDVAGVGVLDSLRGRGFWQSAEGRRMRTLGENAVRRYLRLESGASISDEEMRAEMELRGMGPGATERQWREGLRDLERDLTVRRQARGRSAPNASEAPQGGAERPRRRQAAPASSGSAPRGGASGGDMVRVRHPDGRTGTIPRANLQRATAAGFEEVR